jgi:hypothetical protein
MAQLAIREHQALTTAHAEGGTPGITSRDPSVKDTKVLPSETGWARSSTGAEHPTMGTSPTKNSA